MATIAIPGRKAFIRFSTASSATTAQTSILELQNPTLTVEVGDIDVTNHDSSGWAERIDGIKSATWEATANFVSTGAQGAIRQSLLDGDATQYMTWMASTSLTAKKFQFKTRIRSFSMEGPTDGQLNATFSGQSHGAIVRTA